jgi:hypothetical protein
MKFSLIQTPGPSFTLFHQVKTFSSATCSLTVFTPCVLPLELTSFIPFHIRLLSMRFASLIVCHSEVFLNLTEIFLTLTEVFPCFSLSCNTNAKVKLSKTGARSTIFHKSCYLCCSMYCLCVNVYCNRVKTQLQLINVSYYTISYNQYTVNILVL